MTPRSVAGVFSRRPAWVVPALAPIVLGLILAAGAALVDPPRRDRAEDAYAIAPGTAARVRAGVPVEQLLPRHVVTRVGRTLRVTNHDSETHTFGPFALAPGQSWSRQYAQPGAYRMSCSVYPTADFTVEVAGDAVGAGAAAVAHRLALIAWIGLVAALFGALARLVIAAGAGEMARPLVLALPGATLALAATGALALSRQADWGPVLASGAVRMWLLDAVGWSVVAAVVLSLVGDAARSASGASGRVFRALVLLCLILALGATAVGLWPVRLWSGAALAVAGGGWLLAAVFWQAFDPRGQPTAAGPPTRRLALAGLAMLLAGMRWPAPTPPDQAMVGVIVLAAGGGLIAVARRDRGRADERLGQAFVGHAGTTNLLAAAGLALVVWGTIGVSAAVLAHLDAVTLPIYGNPVPADAGSLARGATIWEFRCAACHAAPPDVRERDDRDVLAVLTNGFAADGDRPAMPGFAYTLDLTARGDVLNYLRGTNPARAR